MKLILVIFFVVGLTACNSQHVSLIGSRQLPTTSDLRVFLSAQDLTEDSIINVTLHSDPDYTVSKVYEKLIGELSQDIGFTLPQNRPSSYRLNIVHSNRATNLCMRQSVTIEDTTSHHLIFIHHDKPIYKNGDKIRFRTFVLDRHMLPYRYTSMNVTILDGRQNVIKRFENVQSSEYGVYEDYVLVAESPNLGVWRIEVEVDGKTRSKHFPVKYHDENSFEVVVQSLEREVSFDDGYVFLRIQAKSPVNKIFNGVAKISSSARFDGKDEVVINRFIRNVTLPLDKPEVTLKIESDLGIRSPSADMIATLTVEVVEERTRRYEKVSVDVPLRMYRNKLKLDRKPYFKPGLDFDMTIKARTLNDEPDNSLRQLTMKVDYEEFDEDTHSSSTRKENFNLNLKNGELDVVLHPSAITVSIKVFFEFGGAELTDRITKVDNHGVKEYMRATIQNKKLVLQKLPQYDKKKLYEPTEILQMSVISTKGLQTLNVLVIGRGGLLYSKSYPEAHGKESFKFSVQLTEQMSPEAYVVTFYARAEDGVIISDELPISIRHTANNWFEVTPTIQSTKPNTFVKLNLNSTQDSRVYLTAIDQNVTLLGRLDDVSLTFVHSEVLRYINQYPNMTQNYDFSRINSFVLQPLVSGVPCGSPDKLQSGRWIDEELTLEDKLTQKYFPDLWLDESIIIKNEEMQTIQRQTPNDLTSWLLYGVSMHPTKGLAVINKEVTVSLFNEVAVKVHSPESIRHGEVLNVELSVRNNLKSSQNVQIVATVDNGDIMDEKTTTVAGKPCRTYTRRRQPSQTFTVTVPANSMSTTQTLFVQPNSLGEMKITVKATGVNGAIDVADRIIQVQERRNLREDVAGSILIELGDNGSMEKNVRLTVPANRELVDVYAIFTGSLLGPVLSNLDLFSNVPIDYREPKSTDFMLSMIVAEYHESRHDQVPVEIRDEMLMGYQETLESLQHVDSHSNSQKSALFYAYATFALIKAKNFMEVDDRMIEMALDSLKSKQGPDGSFMDGPVVDMGQMSSQRHILTAQFTLAFIKYQKYSNKYDDVISRAMKWLDSTKTQLTTDYEKVLVAYTFMAHGDKETSKQLTSSLTCTFANNPDFKEETSLYVGIASFLIELRIDEGVDPKLEIEWLLRQRRSDGMFFSPHDTLSALHALLTYELNRNVNQLKLHVAVDGQSGDVTERNQVLRVKLSQKDQYTLNVNGVGLGYASIFYEYTERETNTTISRDFEIYLNRREIASDMLEITVDVIQVTSGIKTPNLVIVEVEMPSGYQFLEHNDAEHVKMVDDWEDRTIVVFYIEVTKANQVYRQAMHAVKVYQVESTASSVVRVYDYYRPNIREELEYTYDINTMNCRPR